VVIFFDTFGMTESEFMSEEKEDINWNAIGLGAPVDKSKRKYQAWAMRFFIYNIITQLAAFIFTIIYPLPLYASEQREFRLASFKLIAVITLLLTIVELVRSFQAKEAPTWRRRTALTGVILLLIEFIVLISTGDLAK
jgi:hypothetical protein